MLDDDDGRPLVGKLSNHPDQPMCRSGVEIGQRLIEDEQAGLEHQCAGDGDLLALAPGELVGGAALEVGQARRGQDHLELPGDLLSRPAQVLRAKGKLGGDRRADQLLTGILEDSPDELGQVPQPGLRGGLTSNPHASSEIAPV